jgi:DUF438 domain-containing protein
MATNVDPQTKKQTVKNILRALHAGLDPARAAERVLKEAGYLTSAEIAAIEEELLAEGIQPEEIQRFCNVHALIFEKAMRTGKSAAPETAAVGLFKAENGRIRRLVAEFRSALAAGDYARAGQSLDSFSAVVSHYVKKENALFPLLEKRGFSGPSKVMWGKHDEVRRLLKEARAALGFIPGSKPADQVKTSILDPLLAEIEGMIEKEELILFPTALEKLTAEDWERVRASFIELEREGVVKEIHGVAEPTSASTSSAPGDIVLPSGRLSAAELTRILNLLPVDLSFVDANDRVKYFSEPAARIFPRARSVIGRKVQNCHPPKSLKAVERIIDAFRTGRKDSADFWIELGGKMISIRYLAVRDESGKYLGTLEVSQDISGLRALSGEKRLLDEENF